MPQVCLRVAQYENQYISRKKAMAQLAEAKQGFLVSKEEGDETAQSWLDETEAAIRQRLQKMCIRVRFSIGRMGRKIRRSMIQ